MDKKHLTFETRQTSARCRARCSLTSVLNHCLCAVTQGAAIVSEFMSKPPNTHIHAIIIQPTLSHYQFSGGFSMLMVEWWKLSIDKSNLFLHE